MAFPTLVRLVFPDTVLKSCTVTNNKLIKIKTLPPKTAALLGVIPHSEIRNKMAERAMPLTITVTAIQVVRLPPQKRKARSLQKHQHPMCGAIFEMAAQAIR